MKRGIRLGTVGGVRLVVGRSWLVVLPAVAFGLFVVAGPASGSAAGRALVAAGGSVLLWVSVLVHELGHVVAAQRRGIEVEEVVVLLAGGYSQMDLDNARPEEEWSVAASGPLASGLLGAGLAAAAWAAPSTAGLEDTLAFLALVNGGVAAFNLLPTLPLDGGRMLRSALVGRGRSPRLAERLATWTGIVFGGTTVAVGVVISLFGDVTTSLVVAPVGLLVLALAVGSLRSSAPSPTTEET
jgi:Zn-dependent protease